MKYFLLIILSTCSFCMTRGSTELHGNQCDETIGFHEKVLPKHSAYNYYRVEVYDGPIGSGGTLQGHDEFDYASRPTFLSIDQNSTYSFLYGTTYYVRIGTRATLSDPWDYTGSTCTVEFENTVKLHNNRCDNLAEHMHQTIRPKHAHFYSYNAFIYTDASCTNLLDETGEFYAVGSAPKYLTFAQTIADLNYNQDYWVRFKVKNTSTSVESPFGPICQVRFENIVKLHNNRCDVYNQSPGTTFHPNYGGFAAYLVNAYDANNNLVGSGEVYNGSSYSKYQDFTTSLHCGIYTIKYQVKNTSSSSWSPEGPECEISLSSGTIIYVDQDATGANNGMNWTNAYTALEDALANYCDGSKIWVAEGTYYPNDKSGTSDRTQFFELTTGVEVYGGFDGTESASFNLDNRDIQGNLTTLSGDLDKDDVNDNGNAYRVVYMHTQNDPAIVDGFTIEMGRANLNNGSGLGSDKFKGGGIYCRSADIDVRNCILRDNYGIDRAGAAFVRYGGLDFTNCIFRDNDTDGPGGAGVSWDSDVSFLNCTFSGNTSTGNYPVWEEDGSCSIDFDNCIVWDNGSGDGIENNDVTITNSIYDGTNLTGTNLSSSDPLFNSDLSLQSTSPAIDPSNYTTNTLGIDIGGNDRDQGTNIDWGAWEHSSGTVPFGTDVSVSPQRRSVTLYPNPAHGSFVLENSNAGLETQWEIVDLLGNVLMQGQTTGQQTQIDISNLASGQYLVVTRKHQSVETNKLMVD